MTAQVKERPRINVKALPANLPSFRLSRIELAALTLTIAAVVLVIAYYSTALGPVQGQLATVEREMQLVKSQVDMMKSDDKLTEKDRLRQAKDSLAAFQSDWLKPYSQGRINAINEINGMVKADGVHLTSGISVHSVPNAALNQRKSSSKKKDEEFLLDVYPRVQMNFVVFGDYANLRKFIKHLQASKQFLVVESMSIATVEQRQSRNRAVPSGPVSGLALSVGLNAFFHP